MSSYDASSIKVGNWPKARKVNGGWERVWRVELEESPTPASILGFKPLSDNEGKRATVESEGPGVLLRVLTSGLEWDDEVILFNQECLKAVEVHLGTIRLVQGQEKDVWRPWWKRSTSHGGDC